MKVMRLVGKREEIPETLCAKRDVDIVQKGVVALVRLIRSPRFKQLRPLRKMYEANLACPSSLPIYRVEGLEVADGPQRTIGRCINKNCAYYRSFCSLGVAVAATGASALSAGLTVRASCSIRNMCRWYAENGQSACQLCPSLTRFYRDSTSFHVGEKF